MSDEQKCFDTLFLDRDGVINKRIPNDYVRKWEDFEFLSGVLEAMSIFSKKFKYVFIVTNQRGVGKDLMTQDNLNYIHRKMVEVITKNNGRVDKVYYCTDIDINSPMRKPNPGMGLQAKYEFPEIDFKRSIMIGDSLSDVEFGERLGMKTILMDNFEVKNALLNFALNLACE